MSRLIWKPYDHAKPKRAPHIDDEVWEFYKPFILQMHLASTSRTKMLKLLDERHEFRPSNGQLVARCKFWGFQVHVKTTSQQNEDGAQSHEGTSSPSDGGMQLKDSEVDPSFGNGSTASSLASSNVSSPTVQKALGPESIRSLIRAPCLPETDPLKGSSTLKDQGPTTLPLEVASRLIDLIFGALSSRCPFFRFIKTSRIRQLPLAGIERVFKFHYDVIAGICSTVGLPIMTANDFLQILHVIAGDVPVSEMSYGSPTSDKSDQEAQPPKASQPDVSRTYVRSLVGTIANHSAWNNSSVQVYSEVLIHRSYEVDSMSLFSVSSGRSSLRSFRALAERIKSFTQNPRKSSPLSSSGDLPDIGSFESSSSLPTSGNDISREFPSFLETTGYNL